MLVPGTTIPEFFTQRNLREDGIDGKGHIQRKNLGTRSFMNHDQYPRSINGLLNFLPEGT
uniref:Uncharacterized protein n=1 Tax=Cucumis melo TaxID=3656 RepID=A0A9I9E8Z8_CUCME